MMVKRLLLSSGFWQQRNADVPTFVSHSAGNGGMWVKIYDKDQYVVKVGNQTQECDYQALLQVLERRHQNEDLFANASSYFLKEKKKLCSLQM
ncbi:MAG TPA: hypothetical protein VKK79_04900 [Candidatus Lokiarchaeia archaeon]|nr:hypothetical protein [Candidatus Lokiarchaeia archaeon]